MHQKWKNLKMGFKLRVDRNDTEEDLRREPTRTTYRGVPYQDGLATHNRNPFLDRIDEARGRPRVNAFTSLLLVA